MKFDYKNNEKTSKYTLKLWMQLYFDNRKLEDFISQKNLLGRMMLNWKNNHHLERFLRFCVERSRITISEISIVKYGLSQLSTEDLEFLKNFLEVPVAKDTLFETLKSAMRNIVRLLFGLLTAGMSYDVIRILINGFMDNIEMILQDVGIIISGIFVYSMLKWFYVEVITSTIKQQEINRILPLLVNDILKERKQMKS